MVGVDHAAFTAVDGVWRAEGSGRHETSTRYFAFDDAQQRGHAVELAESTTKPRAGDESPPWLAGEGGTKKVCGSSGRMHRRASSTSSSNSYGSGMPPTDPMVAALGFGKGDCGSEMRPKKYLFIT
jgi:hypothetical protein